MKSIDNLREYVLTAPSICSTTRAILVGYIDGIEREVAEVHDRDYRNGMEDGEMAAERDGWVRKEEGKTISAYYVDVVPRFDWKLMALELEQFAEIVRGMAGDDE